MTNNPSTTTRTSTDSETEVCLNCGSDEFESGPLDLDSVCTSCGAVGAFASNPERDESQKSDQGEQLRWSDYYTVTNSTEQQVATALEHLERISGQLEIPDQVRVRAADIYGQAAIEGTTDGCPTEVVVIAAVIIASREVEVPHPIGHIGDLTGVDLREIKQALSRVKSDLYLYTCCPPEAYLSELTKSLELNNSAVQAAHGILDNLPGSKIGGKHPGAVAGAALYLAVEGDITQREIARVCGVTTETVRLRVKECRKAHQPKSDSGSQ